MLGKKIAIKECVYNVHPVYNLYAASEDGQIIHIVKQFPNIRRKQFTGYRRCCIRRHGDKNQENYFLHRFVWQCFQAPIPEDKVIDHIKDNKENNRLCNLQIVTQWQNCTKAAKKRDYA